MGTLNKKVHGGDMNRERYAELKGILEERRREIMDQVQEKIRDVRTEGANSSTHGVLDAAETSESDIQDEIEFALITLDCAAARRRVPVHRYAGISDSPARNRALGWPLRRATFRRLDPGPPRGFARGEPWGRAAPYPQLISAR
ncbi:MAG: hypothetical protein LC804_16410 [Acidobacteria bacterium]|nr:hypothetical protein [Acidobacteriota bacterium]